MPEVEPLASTVKAVSSRRGLAFRIVTPALIIGVLGVGLMVWARDRLNTTPQPDASQLSSRELIASVGSRDAASYGAGEPMPLPPLSLDTARRIVDSFSHGKVGDVRVVRKGRGVAIVAIHDERRAGTSHLFMMERSGTRYRVTGRAPLDASGFRGANWTAKSLDVDGDGSDEVLCAGTNAKDSKASCRVVLYVPRTRQTYTMSVEAAARGKNSPRRVTWSPNALKRAARPYRAALQRHARALLSSL